MEAYAVVETGGKQYRVEQGSVLDVERLEGEAGSQVELGRVLAVSDGASLTVGTPDVAGASVTASIVEQHRGPKIISFKKKKRKGYSRKVGHRQELTKLRIETLPAASSGQETDDGA